MVNQSTWNLKWTSWRKCSGGRRPAFKKAGHPLLTKLIDRYFTSLRVRRRLERR
jgi:hypothetical protein